MAQRVVLGVVLSQMIKEFSGKIPEDKQHEVEHEAGRRLHQIFGADWSRIPVTGPYMMLIVLILNRLLVPYGVTPVAIADKAIGLARDYGMDEKFNYILRTAKETAQTSGEFTADKLNDMMEYSKATSQKIADYISENYAKELQMAKEMMEKGIETGKALFKDFKSKATDILKKDDSESTQ